MWFNGVIAIRRQLIRLRAAILDHKSRTCTVEAGCCDILYACVFLQFSRWADREQRCYKVPRPCAKMCPCNNNPILIRLLRLCVLDYQIWRMFPGREDETNCANQRRLKETKHCESMLELLLLDPPPPRSFFILKNVLLLMWRSKRLWIYVRVMSPHKLLGRISFHLNFICDFF